MALVDVLIGIVIGVVGGVIVPAAVLYRYRHRVGQWLIERQAQQTFEEEFDLEGAFAGGGAGENPFGEAARDEVVVDETVPAGEGFGAGGMVEGVSAGAGATETGFGDVGAPGNESNVADTADDPGNAADTADDPGSGTRRCDCGELVSPQLDEECPNCGAPVAAE